MPIAFGLDIGTTSIGFAVIDHDSGLGKGTILRLGVRIFPEARDPNGVPLNQERRQARLRRRQLRRRRERRRLLADVLHAAGLLPPRNSSDWDQAMKRDPYDLRRRAFEGETLSPQEVGRAVYHLAQRRHFRGRDIDEISDAADDKAEDADERKATTARDLTAQALKREGKTLGAWLAERGPHERKRREHATRDIVEEEFDKVWLPLIPEPFRTSIQDAIFVQRPVFWRLNTLGRCRFVPDAPLCPKAAWLSQQRRMLEKLNNLSLAGGNQRPLDPEERLAILSRLQTQASMTWPGVRRALAPLYRARGAPGEERALKFNLEEGGERKLLGNPVEAKLADIFGSEWQDHPRKQEIRESLPHRMLQADYERVGDQRVVILPKAERRARRAEVARHCVEKLGLSNAHVPKVETLKLPSGWEPYSVEALQVMLPHLEDGARFGELINGPDWEEWRAETFPDREQPTGEVFDRLPSPAHRDEREHIASLRNPTVARARNELRKVVNNLIDLYGKPDLIRVEVARDVGNSRRQREEKASGIRRQERRRKAAREALEKRGIAEPSRTDVEKWLLWEECGKRCPYTGDTISFEALFQAGEFEVEHIWPRSRSLDNSFRNKTLCRTDVNLQKGNQTPYEFFRSNEEEWDALANRLASMRAAKGGTGMSPGKIRRFLAPSIPEGFVTRQLNDTGYAAREAVAYLKKLWPDQGPKATVKVFAVSGRVTGHLRRLWHLNNILAEDGAKTRADHRHHAIDALTVACCYPEMTQKLSRHWQEEDDPRAPRPHLPSPWETIRSDAERAAAAIVVSHRVRRKVSGQLHKETIYRDTGEEIADGRGTTYRVFVRRKPVEKLTNSESERFNGSRIIDIVDDGVRDIVQRWVDKHGGHPGAAFVDGYPKRGRKGPEIRKVRLRVKQQLELMTKASTGYADQGNNHHIAIYRLADGSHDYDVVSLMEASRRKARHEPVVNKKRGNAAQFVMSLSPGDVVEFQEGEEAGLWVMHGINSSGRPALARINDARPASATAAGRLRMDGKRETFEPRFGGFMKRRPKKLSVDPIGRVRPAND